MGLQIGAISIYLPEHVETNDDLVSCGRVPYSAIDIERKTGIRERRISSCDETPVYMAKQACDKLLQFYDPETIDWLIFCTQTPDYMLPSSSCILHGLLGLNSQVGAFDISLSCTGYVYSLVVCDALLKARKNGRILLVNADNYTKYLDPQDANVSTIFGDAATATLLEYNEDSETGILGYKLCTEGRGYEKLIRTGGGSCFPMFDINGIGAKSDPYIRMDGPEIFRFVQKNIPINILALLEEHHLIKDQIDYYLLHQASEYMLRTLAQRLGVNQEKVPVRLKLVGNTISATIPLLIYTLGLEGMQFDNKILLLSGFGAGLSYGSLIINTGNNDIKFIGR